MKPEPSDQTSVFGGTLIPVGFASSNADAPMGKSIPPRDLVRLLKQRVEACLRAVEQTDIYRAVTAPTADLKLVRLIMREVYFEIYSYHAHVTEAATALVGKFPRSDVEIAQLLLRHQADEAGHGRLALADYVALGGDENDAANKRLSPASFAAASLWWGLWKMESPYAGLGALYLFEALTPIISARARAALLKCGFPTSALKFITLHEEADVEHALLMETLVERAATNDPSCTGAILAGIDYFLAVYPIPVWTTAYLRARSMFVELHEDGTASI